jgi:membrane-associated phospholipid phosphatase
LHPLLMPSYGLLIIFNSGTYLAYLPAEAKRLIFMIVLACTFALPLLLIPYFIYRGYIRNVEMNTHLERTIPLIFTAFLFYLAFFLLKSLGAPQLVRAFMLASTLSVVATLVVSYFWKISAHMVGIGGLAAAIFMISFLLKINLTNWFILLLVAGGLSGYARLSLDAHTPAQVYSGFFLGLLTVALTLSIF